jgi:hypothetical protein
MDIEVCVAIGNYSIDVSAEDTDALFLADALHSIETHLAAMQKLPGVKKAMSTPLSLDDD